MLALSALGLLAVATHGAPAASFEWTDLATSAPFKVSLGGIGDSVELSGLPVRVHANGRWHSSADGSLQPGVDTGDGSQVWRTADGVRIVTSVEAEPSGDALIFRTTFPDGANGTSVGDYDAVASEFPALDFSSLESGWGYYEYHGNQINKPFAGRVGTMDVLRHDEDSAGLLTRDQRMGGQKGGIMLLFDQAASRSLVLSGASSFMAANMLPLGGSSLAMGVNGGAESVPAGWSISFVLRFGAGIGGNVQGWGRLLRSKYNRTDAARKDDMTNSHLGYNTDNGAEYYYQTAPNKTYLETFLAVSEEAKQKGVAFRHLLLDSWWYSKDEGGAVTDWSPTTETFPGGWSELDTLRNATGWAFTMHNRYWSAKNIYAKENGGNFTFVLERDLAVPDDEAFWDYLFSSRKEHGLYTYEQDWLISEYENIDVMKTDVELARRWLLKMGAAAERQGIFLQYCMSLPRHILQSLEVPRVSQARASDDNTHLPIPARNVWIGTNSLLLDSLGLAPAKDIFLTRFSELKDGTSQKYPSLEAEYRLHALVATLSTGPVTSGDVLGTLNGPLLLRSSDAAGRLLRPSSAAVALDIYFTNVAFSSAAFLAPIHLTGAPYLQRAAMHVPGYEGELLLGFHLLRAVSLAPAELGLDLDEPLFAMKLATSEQPKRPISGHIQRFDRNSTLDMHTALDFHYWQVLRPLPAGPSARWLLLGELEKWVPMSPDRVLDVQASAELLRVRVQGAPHEQVGFSFVDMSQTSALFKLGKRSTLSCELSDAGFAVLELHTMTCSSAVMDVSVVAV